MTQLIGRDDELRRLEAAVARSSRLITLHGPAGVGKSRLASAVTARISSQRFPGGVFWCELQAVSTEREVLDAVLAVLGTSAEQPVTGLALRLEAKGDLLLVLDNVEPALSALATVLPSWLAVNPRLRIVTTTRERLGLPMETVQPVGPLYPTAARALLAERLCAVQPERNLVDEELDELARRLDHLPLAIELTARHALALTPAELLEQLDPVLPFLQACERLADPRSRSLRDALDVTWGSLSEPERTVALSCALFQNAFTVADVEAVGGALERPVAFVLTELAEKSVVRVEATEGGSVFSLLRTTREYLYERSTQAAKHLQFAASFTEALLSSAEERLPREYATEEAEARHVTWLKRHQQTWFWLAARALERSCPETALRVLLVMNRSVLLQGPVPRALQLFKAIELQGFPDPHLSCRGLLARGRLQIRDGQLFPAKVDLLQGLKQAESLDDASLIAALLTALAEVQRRLGASRDALARYQQALSLYEAQNDACGCIRVQSSLAGMALEAGSLADARRFSKEALGRLQGQPMQLTEATVLQNLGVVLQELGEPMEAARCFQTSLASHRALGHRRFEGIGEFDLACLALEGGVIGEAQAGFVKAVALAQEVGDRREQGLSEALLAVCEAKLGEIDVATQRMKTAHAALMAASEPVLLAALDLHHGHLDLAAAIRALSADDETRRLQHWRAAKARLSNAENGAPPGDELRFALRLLRTACQQHAALDTEVLVASSGEWFRTPGGTRVNLANRAPLQRLLQELIRQKLFNPKEPVDMGRLIRAAWPEQRSPTNAAKNRLHVALTTLRKSGLGLHLTRKGEGYLLERVIPCSAVLTPIMALGAG